jgi:DeoR family transcriptional regulator of aga operon
MFNEERKQKILQLLAQKERVFVNDLCELFETTSVTIRKDLDQLEEEGHLRRVHGGAIINKSLYPGMALPEKQKLNLEQKEKIARKAVNMINKGDVILLDSGSTTHQLAKLIKELKGITVITNGINIAAELMNSDNDVIITGGMFDKGSSTLYGPLTEETLQHLAADKLFQGVDGIDLELGFTTPSIEEAQISRRMMKISGQSIVLADSSKFGRRSLSVIGKITDADTIITDDGVDDNYVKSLTEKGLEVIIA